MIILRIQETADEKGLTLEEISQVSGISLEVLQTYATTPIEELTQEIAANLRKIAEKLDVPVLELVKPVAKRGAFKLKILEMAQQKGLTLEKLSEQTGVHPAILAFYSTQPICKNKLAEFPCQGHLSKISNILGCCIEDLKIAADLPVTMLRIEELANEKGLTLENWKALSGLPNEFIDMILTQPVNVNFEERFNNEILRDLCCQLCDLYNVKCSCCNQRGQ